MGEQDQLTVVETWGNAVGYWQWLQEGQEYGATVTLTVTRTTESTTSHTFSETAEQSFSSTEGLSQTHSTEVGCSANYAGLGASAKYGYAATLSDSTTSAVRTNIINSLTHATSSGTSITASCTSAMPNEAYHTYVWTVYRASSIENVGASQQTCTFWHQTGACKYVPPNCPIGTCQDSSFLYCAEGTEPLTPIPDLMASFPACFEEMFGDLQCHPDLNDYDCCSSSNPCR